MGKRRRSVVFVILLSPILYRRVSGAFSNQLGWPRCALSDFKIKINFERSSILGRTRLFTIVLFYLLLVLCRKNTRTVISSIHGKSTLWSVGPKFILRIAVTESLFAQNKPVNTIWTFRAYDSRSIVRINEIHIYLYMYATVGRVNPGGCRGFVCLLLSIQTHTRSGGIVSDNTGSHLLTAVVAQWSDRKSR